MLLSALSPVFHYNPQRTMPSIYRVTLAGLSPGATMKSTFQDLCVLMADPRLLQMQPERVATFYLNCEDTTEIQ